MVLKSCNYKELTYLPYNLVKESFDERWERSLLFFIQLRKLNKKPIFYNYTFRNIAQKANCSHSCARKHIEILKSKGLVSISGNNLCLAGTNRLLKQYKSFIVPVKYLDNKKDQLTALRFVLIRRNFKLQEYGYKTAIDILKCHKGSSSEMTSKQIKSLLKKEKIKIQKTGTSVEKSLRNNFILSNKKFGSLCNRSILTGLKIQKDLNRLNLIKSHRCIRLYRKKFSSKKEFFLYKEYHPYRYLDSSYLLSNKNYLYRVLPNKVTIQ